jgi:hypothetical protein
MYIHNYATGLREVINLSPQQMHERRTKRMRLILWCGVMGMTAGCGDRTMVMYTLTYKGVSDWRPNHIGEFMAWGRTRWKRRYVWCAELQKRGAPHYHVLTVQDKGERWEKPDAENGGWPYGFTWVTPDIKYPWYILKYIQKGSESTNGRGYPKGMRIYAVSMWARSSMEGKPKDVYRSLQLPNWFKAGAQDAPNIHIARRVAGGIGYGGSRAISPYTGRYMVSVDEVMSADYNAAIAIPNPSQSGHQLSWR